MAFVLAAVPALAQSGGVKGSVADAATKAPIAGAVVKLYRGDQSVQTGGSDGQGLFRLTGLPDGLYRVAIDHPDYLPLASDHAAAGPFAITATTAAADLSAELVPLGEIAGRVLDPAGKSITGVPVGLRRHWDEQWVQIGMSGEEGRFHFRRLEPGPWILGAMPSFRISLSDPTKDPKPVSDPVNEEGQRVGWATTFFPDTLDLADAEKIVLRPGALLDGYAVRLRTVPLRRLSGIVIDEEGNPAPQAMVSLNDVANKGANGRFKTTDRSGRYEFEVQDGEWRIFAQLKNSGATLRGYRDVRVSRRDLAGIEVQAALPFPLKGFVERDEPRGTDGKRQRTGVSLVPLGASSDVQVSAFHDEDGSLVLKSVYRGRYRVLPLGHVPGYYVASIWYGDQEATTEAIEIVNPLLPLKIVYRPGAGRVTGTVDRGEGAWVVLVPRDEALRDSDQFIRTTHCRAHGQFTIDNLRPGSYYALAFGRVRRQMLEDVAFVRNLVPRAVRVDVRKGEAVNLELNLMGWPDY